jgi:sulfur carrier protein ThiS
MRITVDISPVLHIMIPNIENDLPAGALDLAEGSGVGAVLKKLDFTLVPILLVLNGNLVDEDAVLREGDTLKILPMVNGG